VTPGQTSDEEPAATEATEDQPHDDTGLELARSLAHGMRGRGPTRRAGASRKRRRAGDAELSGAHPDARDPALVVTEVDKLVAESGWETEVAVHGVFARWPTIVGTDVAGHCTPQSYQDGRLVVQTDSTAWATQLKLLAPNVVRRMNEELGHGTVRVIEVVGPDGPSWSRGPRSVRGGRGPRDTYG